MKINIVFGGQRPKIVGGGSPSSASLPWGTIPNADPGSGRGWSGCSPFVHTGNSIRKGESAQRQAEADQSRCLGGSSKRIARVFLPGRRASAAAFSFDDTVPPEADGSEDVIERSGRSVRGAVVQPSNLPDRGCVAVREEVMGLLADAVLLVKRRFRQNDTDHGSPVVLTRTEFLVGIGA